MTLAWQNEWGVLVLKGLRRACMVSVHGVLNGLIAAPAFLVAIAVFGRAIRRLVNLD